MMVGVVLSSGAQAAPGDLDPSFSGDGKQTTDLGGGAKGVAIQADGKIVAVGLAGGAPTAPTSGSPATTRTARSTRASPATAGGGPTSAGARLREGGGDPGGRQDRRGRLGSAGGDFALARYNPNGSLDPSFSGDGKQTTDFGGFDATARTRWRSRRTARSSRSARAGDGDFALARYNPNGSLDTSFSGDGKQTTDFGGLRRGERRGLQADGKIVAVGGSSAEEFGDFALARYNPDGSLDPSFSGDGKQTTQPRGSLTSPTEWRSRRTARSSRSASLAAS